MILSSVGVCAKDVIAEGMVGVDLIGDSSLGGNTDVDVHLLEGSTEEIEAVVPAI